MSQKGRKSLIYRFFVDESGQSTTEYILILAVVVMIAMKFKDEFKKRLLTAVNKIGKNIEDAVDDTTP